MTELKQSKNIHERISKKAVRHFRGIQVWYDLVEGEGAGLNKAMCELDDCLLRNDELPIMNVQREGWRFTILFSNTQKARDLGKTND